MRRDLAAAMSSNHHTAAPSPLAAFSSLGDYVAGWAGSRHTEAADAYDHLVKALITTDDAVMIPSWLGVIQADMKARQPILDLFTHTQDLPATGLSVSYGILTDETTEPGVQAAQGAELVNMGKVSLDAASPPVWKPGASRSRRWATRWPAIPPTQASSSAGCSRASDPSARWGRAWPPPWPPATRPLRWVVPA